ncbi:MAG: hypothetical protein JXR48_13155 [Candidatus Delongbacteria bacterium]|nr:hypothetical protein [Candidatus Delongbacteria bacterium]MBN2835902.1 hypothetical protein [Candidatus Delongbacteria bacterium]
MRKIVLMICILMISSMVNATAGFGQDLMLGVRQLSLGGAFTGVADDQFAVYYNPAGLSSVDGLNFSINYSKNTVGESDISFNTGNLTASYNFGKFGALGINWYYSTSSDDNDGSEVFNVSEHNVELGYGYSFAENLSLDDKTFFNDFSMGFGTRLIGYGADMDDVTDYFFWDIALDYSILMKMMENRLTFGAMVQNLPYICYDHAGWSGEDVLEIGYRTGLSYRFNKDNLDDFISADVSSENEAVTIGVGAEKSFGLSFSDTNDLIIHRAGYRYGVDDKFHEFNLGLGYVLPTELFGKDVRFDYNFNYTGGEVAGDPMSHAFQLSFKF